MKDVILKIGTNEGKTIHLKLYSVWWNYEITADTKRDIFERIALSGIHFNEDIEENWIEYNYGVCEWDKLTEKMKDQIEKWGL